MKKLRFFDSLKLVLATVACIFILNVAHADETCDTHWENYVSATGTVSQSGTPSPSNRIEPKFYTQGDMVLRAVDDVADSYDAGTGKITRRIGIKVFNGTESWTISSGYSGTYTTFWLHPDNIGAVSVNSYIKAPVISNYFSAAPIAGANSSTQRDNTISTNSYAHASNSTWIRTNDFSTVAGFKSWLAERYAAGNPVVMYYQLATPVEEDWTSTQYCVEPIKIATTRYNEEQFEPVKTDLSAAVNAVEYVVSNTMTQAQAIDQIATNKQTRPDEGCPAKYCLLVEDEDGTPHWYPIAGANGVAHALPAGYTELQYLQTNGNSWIDTGIKGDMSYKYEIDFQQLDAGQYRNWGAFDQSAYNGGPNMSLTYVSGFAVRWTVSGSNSQVVNLSSLDSNRHHIIIDNGYITWDGVNKGRSTGHQDNYVFGYNLFLGTVNPGGNTPTSNAKSKYYSYKVWNTSGDLIQNFIPARRDSDGVLGMYDLADPNPSTAFYTNVGTGTFTAGPDM